MERLRKLDVYPKINEDFFTRTTAGGFITLTSSVLMLMLFASEARLFLRPHVENVLMVDTSRGAKLQVRRRIHLTRSRRADLAESAIAPTPHQATCVSGTWRGCTEGCN